MSKFYATADQHNTLTEEIDARIAAAHAEFAKGDHRMAAWETGYADALNGILHRTDTPELALSRTPSSDDESAPYGLHYTNGGKAAAKRILAFADASAAA